MLILEALGGLFLALQKSSWLILGWGNWIAGYLNPFLFVCSLIQVGSQVLPRGTTLI